jgi:hypothetical protein
MQDRYNMEGKQAEKEDETANKLCGSMPNTRKSIWV